MARKPLSEMRWSKLPFHPSILIAPVAITFWVIALAGAGASHKQCTKMGGSKASCSAQFGLIWATVFYELVALLVLFGLLPTKFGPSIRVLFAALLTVPTTLFMQHAQGAMVQLESIDGSGGRGGSRAAGGVSQKQIDAMMSSFESGTSTSGRRLLDAKMDLENAYRTAGAGSTLMVIVNLIIIVYLLLEVNECDSCTTAVVKHGNTAQAAPASASAAKPSEEAVPPV